MNTQQADSSFGAIANHPRNLRDSSTTIELLTSGNRDVVEANAGSTFADRGLVPVAWLSDGGYWLLVSDDRNVLSSVECDELMRQWDPMVSMLRETRELLAMELGPVDSYNQPMKVQLHLGPRLTPNVRPKYRHPELYIEHRVIVAGTLDWAVPVKLRDELPDDVRILCFRDRKGGLHLPLDYFLPGINDPLQQALAAQAILAATVTDADALETVLRRHTADLLRNSELFPSPAHERLMQIDCDEIPPLLSLYDAFAQYCRHAEFAASRDRQGADAGPSHLDERRAHFDELRSRLVSMYRDDVETREQRIRDWFPEEVAETIQRFVRGWTVPDLESISLPALRGAVRNLFAIRLIEQAGRSGTRESSQLKSHDFGYPHPTGELRRMFLQRHVTHGELIEQMFAESRFVVIRADFIGAEEMIPIVEEHLPEDLLLVFPARITLLPWPRSSQADFDFEFIDTLVNLFLRSGDVGILDFLSVKELPGRAVHLLPVVEQLLKTAHAKNKSGRRRIHYFPDLADLVPLFASDTIPVADYCRRLGERADELGVRNVLWLETPFGATEQSWRKPDINSADAVHQCLRETVHDRAAWWIQSARLAAKHSEHPEEDLDLSNAAERVSIARFQVHHRSRDCGSPLYEALEDWWRGDFAIPGPLPPGLAELPIHRVSQLRDAFGNYDHLLIRVVGQDDRGDDHDEPRIVPAPKSSPEHIGEGQLNNG